MQREGGKGAEGKNAFSCRAPPAQMNVRRTETPPTLFGKRGPEGKEKGCVMYVGLVLHVAVLHLRCAVYLREPKCCKLHTL